MSRLLVWIVRAYQQEPHEIERFKQANHEYLRRNRVLIRLQGLFYPSMTLFLGLGSLLVLWIGSREVIRGRLSLGGLIAFPLSIRAQAVVRQVATGPALTPALRMTGLVERR